MNKWIDKRKRPEECFTNCGFCHKLIDNKRKGFILYTADFYHWDCLLKLRDEINDIEKKIGKLKKKSE